MNGKKELYKAAATSIICSMVLLDENSRLVKVAVNQGNAYYRVKGCNTCLLHVEEDFCILTDCNVNVYNETHGKCCLPWMMDTNHYGVYQFAGRDWIKNSATSQTIGYDIKHLMHGKNCRPQGTSLDHLNETFDEREGSKDFNQNHNHGSHRKKIEVTDQAELNALLDWVIETDLHPTIRYR